MQSCLCFSRLGKPLLRKSGRPWLICNGRTFAHPNTKPSSGRLSHIGQSGLRDDPEEVQTISPQNNRPSHKSQTFVGASSPTTAVHRDDVLLRRVLSSLEKEKRQIQNRQRSRSDHDRQTFTKSVPLQAPAATTQRDDVFVQSSFPCLERERENSENFEGYGSSSPPLAQVTTRRFDTPLPLSQDSGRNSAEDIEDFGDYSWSPGVALGNILEMRDESERERYWLSIRDRTSFRSLPIITIHYLLRWSVPMTAWSSRDYFIHARAQASLESRCLTWNDVSKWTWILSGDTPEEMADRLISSPTDQPSFILLEILRRDISKVKSLEMLLDYSWDRVLNTTGLTRPSIPRNTSDIAQDIDGSSPPDVSTSPWKNHHPATAKPGDFRMQENTFAVLVSRLLYQARRIWPSAMVDVSKMIAPYLHSISATSRDSLDAPIFARFCKMNNYFLRLLALPSSLNPLQSMTYNWSAQKLLLELAGEFEPPLTLDHASYRAVTQVLTASKKSTRETRSATFRNRSWPPWRVEQDGMDAQRSQDEDFSRVISAIMRSKESGYTLDAQMSIFGGLDIDGTPTIPTRKLLKWRAINASTRVTESHRDTRFWAARIEATRDVHEAWGAFTEFRRKGGQADMSMYFSMFQKLNYESRRSGLESENHATPGDGREVFAVSDDNFSTFYRLRLQPPTLRDLYREMRAAGIRPSGRCLSFLLRHARTTDEGLQYLLDSGLDTQVVAYLANGGESHVPADVVSQVSDQTLTDFISLVCRFAPQVAKTSADSDLQILEHVPENVRMTGSGLKRSHFWKIREPAAHKPHHSRLGRPLQHAAFLLQAWQPRFRPAWYALFRSLARKDIVIVRRLAVDPERICENHEQAWRITRAALKEFHNCGLELDPEGFRLICQTFAKYAEAAFHESEMHRNTLIETSQIIKAECAKLTHGDEELTDGVPRLLHLLKGVHLHVYVRAMGLIGDHAAIISLLGWMVENQKELGDIALQTGNGQRMLRQTVVATRAFCDGTDYEAAARNLVEQVETWGGWPLEEDVQRYRDRGDEQIQNTDTTSDDEEEVREGGKKIWNHK